MSRLVREQLHQASLVPVKSKAEGDDGDDDDDNSVSTGDSCGSKAASPSASIAIGAVALVVVATVLMEAAAKAATAISALLREGRRKRSDLIPLHPGQSSNWYSWVAMKIYLQVGHPRQLSTCGVCFLRLLSQQVGSCQRLTTHSAHRARTSPFSLHGLRYGAQRTQDHSRRR